MHHSNYQPMVEVTRGRIVECVHFGAVAVVDVSGRLVASFGDPETVTFLRSTAKPFQALPFVERDGPAKYGFTEKELALMCASHSGTDEHVAVARSMQAKIGIQEDDLQCGTHLPHHKATAMRLIKSGEELTPNRHNCSGKHTGMLAHAVMRGVAKEEYINPDQAVQQSILTAFAEMCGLEENQVELGIDGCSAPNFAVPLYNAALSYARLADPSGLPDRRAQALEQIWHAMTTYPDMIGGPERFDTLLMQLGEGRLLAKAGAEGYHGLAIRAGALGPGSPALGMAVKIADGDAADRANSTVVIESLRQLGGLTEAQIAQIPQYDRRPIDNFRHIQVGEIRPSFTLDKKLA